MNEKSEGFYVAGEQETDSYGTLEWKQFLDPGKLKKAWEPPEGSPYAKYFKTRLIDTVSEHSGWIKPRYSTGEEKSQREIANIFMTIYNSPKTAVILDSGGAHSVAMAATFASMGYQPIVMLDNIPHINGSVRSHQSLATLLYFAKRIEDLKKTNIIKPTSAPVFVLDAHRFDKPYDKKTIYNSSSLTPDDFPPAHDMSQNFSRVIYVTEADMRGWLKEAGEGQLQAFDILKPVLTSYREAGIKIFYSGAAPWKTSEQTVDTGDATILTESYIPLSDETKQKLVTLSKNLKKK